ncbi:MAG TPA: SMC-Scp complex subunit ScpB, partial [Candidatus Acidoferrales bacterium]|nr:SMC-Scp complex subunit ScpB [Candidatus Acidoferrales bacterium]
LITTAGRKEVIGRPILYRTSKQFMMRFGLSDLDELPSLKEFEQLAQAALGADEGIAAVSPADAPTDEAPVNSEAESLDVNANDALIADSAHSADEMSAAVEAQSRAEVAGEEALDVDANDAIAAEAAQSAAEIFSSGENDDLAELGEDASDDESGSSKGVAAGN